MIDLSVMSKLLRNATTSIEYVISTRDAPVTLPASVLSRLCETEKQPYRIQAQAETLLKHTFENSKTLRTKLYAQPPTS